jgi:hypothetical protein
MPQVRWITGVSRDLLAVGGSLLMLSLIAGCGSQYEIRRYQAPKAAMVSSDAHSQSLETTGPDRMLGAVIAQGEQTWFFKLTGPVEAVEAQVAAFRELLGSLRFEEQKPVWDLPAGWSAKPGSEFRFATLVCGPPESPLEVSVSSLPSGGDPRQYLLANINRWRGQLKLAPIRLGDLDARSERIEVADGTVTLVNFRGSLSGGGMAEAPFARGGTPPPSGLPVESPSGDNAGPGVTFTGTLPADWKEDALVVSRGGIQIRHEAAFVVQKDNQKLEITVDRMPALSNLLPNVNRWRGQIGLEPIGADALASQVTKIEIDGIAADFVALQGATETVLGAIAVRGESAWYFKLKGANELAAAEKANFEALLKAAKLP